ncbi:MAG: glycogen debranching enzyme, partial [Desulfonatronovibrio sp.]
DLVSYDKKHNEANGEDNQDGHNDEGSWNCGIEGPTDDPEILELRGRQQRNFLVTLFLSQGVPMLLGGDEISRTQQGNNNAYCQDNEISWYDWAGMDQELFDFTRKLIEYYLKHPVFRRRKWFQGREIHGQEITDIAWFTHTGDKMAEENWGQDFAKSMGVYLNGGAIPNPNPKGEPVTDDSFYLIFNAHHEELVFTLPPDYWGNKWRKELDTEQGWSEQDEFLQPGDSFTVTEYSMVVLRHVS